MTSDSVVKKKKTYILIIIGLAALIAVLALNVVVWKSNRASKLQIADLNGQISQVEQQVSKVPAVSPDTNNELAAAQDALNAAKTTLPNDINRNDIIDYIIAIAAQCGVKAIPLAVEETIPGKSIRTYNELNIVVTITGTLGNAEDFMKLVQGGEFPTLVITSSSITKTELNDFIRSESDTMVTMRLGIVAYSSLSLSEENGIS
jgi:hypothetical protein